MEVLCWSWAGFQLTSPKNITNRGATTNNFTFLKIKTYIIRDFNLFYSYNDNVKFQKMYHKSILNPLNVYLSV